MKLPPLEKKENESILEMKETLAKIAEAKEHHKHGGIIQVLHSLSKLKTI